MPNPAELFPVLSPRPPEDAPHAPAEPEPPDTCDWRWQPQRVTFSAATGDMLEELGRPMPPDEVAIVEVCWS
jgi:hypothetical protein